MYKIIYVVGIKACISNHSCDELDHSLSLSIYIYIYYIYIYIFDQGMDSYR